MTYPLVKAFWNDAWSPQANISMKPEDIPHKPVKATTVGWLLREDSSGITIASEECDDGEYRGLTFIPAGMLVRTERVGKGVKKKPPPLKDGGQEIQGGP